MRTPASRRASSALGRCRLHGVGDRDQAGRRPVGRDVHHRRTLAPQLVGARGCLGDIDLELLHQRPVAERHLGTFHGADDALAGDRAEVGGRSDRDPSLFGGGDDGRCQGMLARALERSREPQQVGLGAASQGNDRGDLGLALGQRAGLVDHDGVDLLQPLERFRVLDQDAQARAAADAHHDRHRGGKAQGAGAGDDQHRDGGDQAVGERGRRAPQPPGNERDRGDRDHRRHEPAGDLVGEPLDRRARALRLGHHLDDAREHRLLADLLRAHDEAAPAVERAADDLGPGLLLDRQRLAGDHALVDRARSFDDLAVDRHAIARPHPQPIVREHLVEGHFLVAAILTQPARGLGSQVEERLDGAAGLLARAQLEHLAQEAPGP